MATRLIANTGRTTGMATGLSAIFFQNRAALLRFLRVQHGVDLDPVVLAEMVDRLHARTDEPLLRHLEMLCRAVPGFGVRSG